MKKYRKRRRGLNKSQRRKLKFDRLKNKRLVKKYPWLMPTNWLGFPIKNYDYSWIEWGWSAGWDKAFGQIYMDELGEAIAENGQSDDFRILEIKEKYGQARLYCGATSGKVLNIIDKYERISQHICYYCGVEAPMTDSGWVLPQCFDCFRRLYKRNEEWYLGNHPDQVAKTDGEIKGMYEKIICVKPDEDGKYHIPKLYTSKCCSAGGDLKEVVHDYSETVEKIQNRIKKFHKMVYITSDKN